MSIAPLLLVVDDERPIREFLSRYADRAGFRVVTCEDGREALALLGRQSADLALVDLRMPYVGGLEVLRAIRQQDPHCQVVLMSGAGTITDAVEAIKLGARDYLEKPFALHVLQQLLDDTRKALEQRRQQIAIEARLADDLAFCGMIGRSAVMQDLFGLVRRLAPHAKIALITGESGTGKELVARALHQLGPRRDARFMPFSCAAASDVAIESELFGHAAGAYPGAAEARIGAIEAADRGVLFFDEIGELPLSVQGRLLRVLELGEVQRVGSIETRRVDVAVLAATRRDLRTEMLAGRFRRELYYRLNAVELTVPPLRERQDDIPYLAAAFVRDAAARMSKPRLSGLTAPAEGMLRRRAWRGNVRELRNAIEHASMLADGEFLTERELTQAVKQSA